MRKLAALLFLLVLAFVVWTGARRLSHRGEVKATIVFHDAQGLRKGDRVVEGDGKVVGEIIDVDDLGGRHAVTVRLAREHRNAIVTDSLFSIENRTLVVANALAFGKPVEDGAIITARQDNVSRFLAKHGEKMRPYVDKFKAGVDDAFGQQLEQWRMQAPQWKEQGRETFDRNVEAAKARAAKMEEDLRKMNKEEEARKLRARFDQWLKEIRQ